jgi:gluconate 2-dehydrogenase gamma chain
MRRRAFLGAIPAGWAAGSAPVAATGRVSETGGVRPVTLDPDQWRILAKVQDHLLPAEPDNPSAPGARDVNATAYLDRAMAVDGFDPEIRDLITNGIGWLEDLADRRHGAGFVDLDPATREDLLRGVAETDAGERWLATLISYTLEALLADPIYGGNPDGIGWHWLGHVPGVPRPTAENIYGRLGR